MWRQSGAMIIDSKTGNVRPLDRINLRLPGAIFESIDNCRAARPGLVSRNTWITEAIAEKLARDLAVGAHGEGQRRNG
jgi:hypothetical protein